MEYIGAMAGGFGMGVLFMFMWAVIGMRKRATLGESQHAEVVDLLSRKCNALEDIAAALRNANAEAHGRAVARTVQPLVGSLDGDK